MVKKGRFMNMQSFKFGEVSPKLVKYSRGKSTSSPKLETILEETGSDQISFEENLFVSKIALFLLPVFVSFITYFLLCRHVANLM
ncbi:hypothetical protein L484_011444 [Morus notabilis]|uniref:Uncharacterized protein n=1 Tax=Morus notabilis TaxID=981085 RepID=W9R788_9ROSA|nr:hypothetical protein L484_011444 [Morus notabilis]